MLQENADGLSQLQNELDISIADRDRIEAESKTISENLESTRRELRRLISQDTEVRYAKGIAQVDIGAEIFSELDRARAISDRCRENIAEISELASRSSRLEEKSFKSPGATLAIMESQGKNKIHTNPRIAQQMATEEAPKPSSITIDHTIDDQELRSHLVSATSTCTEALQQLHDLEGVKSDASGTNNPTLEVLSTSSTDELATHLVKLSSQFAVVVGHLATEFSELRDLTKSLPPGFSYVEMVSKITVLEQAAKEAGESELGKKGGREEELQRLKQRNASQQNFIMELQEEVATMKGLMFTADEIKRQYSELEDKYRLLENEFTEKAENEVNSRKAKERIELQLTLAHADISTLTRDKESLVVSLKSNEDLISKLELKLTHTVRAYEDVMQQEKIRLETNRDVGTQFSPMLAHVDTQTSFKTPGMTLRQINSFAHVPNRKWGPGSVTPAIVDQRSLSTLELPLSYQRPTTSGSQGVFQNAVAGQMAAAPLKSPMSPCFPGR